MKNAWMWILVAIIVIGGGFWWWQGTQVPALSDDGTPIAQDVTEDNGPSGTAAAMSAIVTYDGKAFSPASVTLKKGGTVTFQDTAGSKMWVASGQHPTHTGYDGTSRSEHCVSGYAGAKPFDQCATGSTYSFTFDKVGSWGYHDHVNTSAYGVVVIEQ